MMLETISSSSRRVGSRFDRAAAVRVLVADPQPLFRDALVRAMERDRAIELTHATGHAAELVQAVRLHSPDVVVADRDLFDGDLLELLRGVSGNVRLLLMAGEASAEDAHRALEDGACGYVSKDADAAALCEAVLAVARGEIRLDRAAQTLIAGEIRLRGRDERPRLSPREQEILTLIADGRTAPQIASELHISTATVKTHLLHLYDKLGVGERAAAVAEGMRLGLLE